MNRRRIISAIVAFGLSFALAIACTWPTILHPTELVVGDPQSDIWSHLWGYWRTERDFLGRGVLPYDEPFLNYPYGGTLYHVDLLNSLYMLPLTALVGRIAAFNMLVWIQLGFAGLTMHLLLFELTKREKESVFFALLFVLSPFVLSFVLGSGVSERLHFGLLPLYFLFLRRLGQGVGIHCALFCGLTFALATLGCWHYGLFLFQMTAFWGLYRMIAYPNRLKTIFTQLVPVALFCAASALPIAQLASGSAKVGERDSFVQREHMLFWDGSVPLFPQNTFSLMDFFRVGADGLYTQSYFDELQLTVYMGLVLPVLMLLGFFYRETRFFALAGCAFATLSLGPKVHFDDGIFVTYSWFYHFLTMVSPYMSGLDEPFEHSLPQRLFMILAAVGVLVRWSKNWRGVSWLFAAVLFFESVFLTPSELPIAHSEAKAHSFYNMIEQQDGEFAVMDFPTRRMGTALFPGEYFYFQTIHKKPIPHAVDAGWLREDPLWMELDDSVQGDGASLIFDELLGPCRQGATRGCGYVDRIEAEQKKKGIRYIILHRRQMKFTKLEQFMTLFERAFGEPILNDSELVVYLVD
ncbi:MAG: hypothetical protein CMK59_09860 [Proteobacteria bacterium]|nr:hypothetical protein [Pseudomonadota bacterium]